MSWKSAAIVFGLVLALTIAVTGAIICLYAGATWLLGAKGAHLLLSALLGLALFSDCSRLPFAAAPAAGVALGLLYFALQSATSSKVAHAIGDVLWWAVFFATIDGGKWLKRKAKQVASSLTGMQELAFRREVEATR